MPESRPRPCAGLLSLVAVWAIACAPQHGSLELRVVDAATCRTTPARLERLDADGAPHVPDDALLLTYECEVAPLPAWAAGFQRRRTLGICIGASLVSALFAGLSRRRAA